MKQRLTKQEMDAIFLRVCTVFEQDPEKVKTRCRKRAYSEVRFVSMVLFVNQKSKCSYEEAAAYFSNLNMKHDMVVYAKKVVNNLREYDFDFMQKTDKLIVL
jgi:chromosomal replication initiation ATPase DnaA